MKIDVCCVTKNVLPSWWFQNLKRVPLNRLIVETSKPLGQARMKAIQQVETPYFAFIDDDVLIGKEWFSEMQKHLSPEVGGISGREQMCGFGETLDNSLNTFRWARGNITLKLGDRGTTVCALLKTDAVRDWKPNPPDTSAWEDWELTQHILRKGLKWLDVNCHAFHIGWDMMRVFKAAIWNYKGVKKVNPQGKYYLPKYLFKSLIYPPLVMLKALTSKPEFNPPFRVALYVFYQNYSFVFGGFFSEVF